jgi:hypothetical protein
MIPVVVLKVGNVKLDCTRVKLLGIRLEEGIFLDDNNHHETCTHYQIPYKAGGITG